MLNVANKFQRFLAACQHRGLVAFVILASAAAYSNYQVFNTQRDFEQESNERRSQSCELFERAHRKDVRNLVLTYEYLTGLTEKQKQDPFNKLIIRQLPEAEAQAFVGKAPPYCSVKGVGLPGPDPKIPQRPDSLNAKS